MGVMRYKKINKIKKTDWQKLKQFFRREFKREYDKTHFIDRELMRRLAYKHRKKLKYGFYHTPLGFFSYQLEKEITDDLYNSKNKKSVLN